MSRTPYSLSKQLVVTTVLALSSSSIALADDSSMNPLTGDSYRYFNGGHNLGEPGQVNRPVYSRAPADPTWRRSHPNGLTESELLALSSSSLARWQLPNGSQNTALAPTDRAQLAQNPSKETFLARLARFFHPDGGTHAGTEQ